MYFKQLLFSYILIKTICRNYILILIFANLNTTYLTLIWYTTTVRLKNVFEKNPIKIDDTYSLTQIKKNSFFLQIIKEFIWRKIHYKIISKSCKNSIFVLRKKKLKVSKFILCHCHFYCFSFYFIIILLWTCSFFACCSIGTSLKSMRCWRCMFRMDRFRFKNDLLKLRSIRQLIR